MKRSICNISDKITHVLYESEGKSDFSEGGENLEFSEDSQAYDFSEGGRVLITQTQVTFVPKTVYRYEVEGEPIIKKKMTANGEVSYIENQREIPWKQSYSIELSFEIGNDEMLLGLGQYEDGIFDYRNHTEYLYESNMKIAIPFLVTTGGYGILIDSESNMIFTSRENQVTFSIDTDSKLSYYIFFGDDIPDIIRQYHAVTGMPSMLPRWAFGYIQSKEKYNNSDEIIETVKRFRAEGIPIDCIVQDWFTWKEGLWGEKIFDKNRYPDLPKLVQSIHDQNVHFMVSIWPNMDPASVDYAQFADAGKLLPNSNMYDAFDKEAQKLYWEQCEREIMAAGTDALWCDNAEPFSDADWSGQYKKAEQDRYLAITDTSKKSMDWEHLNGYGLHHAEGVYENWKKSYPDKPVVNLTRSGYSGCQKYGTILWSGDITATWDTLRRQIVEGMKMSLTGMPYWTLDIGGFFVVNDKYENRGCNDTAHLPLWFWKGDFNDGVEDLGYCELYTRWLQFGVFLPIFRSHGTDTPREPWNFIGEIEDSSMSGAKTSFYNIIVEFIKLRYRLMPYIYSLAEKAHLEGEMMMRSFVMDFADDPVAISITDEYMFGDAFLVAPVYKPMYYGPNSEKLENVPKTRPVYLPKGCGWYDFYTREYYEGGTWIDADAPLSKIPLFVKAGSIIPVSSDIMYADEKGGEKSDTLIY